MLPPDETVVSSASKSLERTEENAVSRFFDETLEASRRAERANEETFQYDYLIGGRIIRMRFASRALLAPVSSAFQHLVTETQEQPDLTVHIWDSASTGVTMPPPPWPKEAQTTGGEIPSFITDRFYTHFDGGVHQLSLIDYERRLAILWIQNHAYIPYWEQSAPLKSIMHIWMSRHGLEWVHGGAVGMPDGGALLVGFSGAGKSSSALACLNSDLQYVGDDHCLVGFNPGPMVYSLYNSAKTHRKDLDKFSFLRPLVSNDDDGPEGRMREKALCFLHQGFAHKLLPGFPLKVLLLPRVTGKVDTTVQPASAGEALKIIAPEIMMKWPSRARASFLNLTKLFRSIPCYQLAVGTDRKQIPEAISELLART